MLSTMFTYFILGIFAQFGEPYHSLWLVQSKKSSAVDEEEIKIKIDAGVDTSLVLEETDLFVDLWEAQNDIVIEWPCDG